MLRPARPPAGSRPGNVSARPNHVVGRHHDHRGVRIVAADQQRREADARGRVAFAGFADDRLSRAARAVARGLASTSRSLVTISRRSGGTRSPSRSTVCRSIVCFADEREKLLGRVGPARRPESSAGAAGHDDGVEHGGKE